MTGKYDELMRQIEEFKLKNPKAEVWIVKPGDSDDLIDGYLKGQVGIVLPEYELMRRFNAFPYEGRVDMYINGKPATLTPWGWRLDDEM